MRLKQVWMAVPIPAMVKLFWERVTFSRITKFYFLFSVLHCLVQVVFQIQAFYINARAGEFLWHLVTQAGAVDPGFSVFGDDELRFCENVPDNIQSTSCQVIWAAGRAKKTETDLAGDSSSSIVPPSTSLSLDPLVSTLFSSVSEDPETATFEAVPSITSAISTTSSAAQTTVGVISSSALSIPSVGLSSSSLPNATPTLQVAIGDPDDDDDEGEELDGDDSDVESVASDDDDDVESVASDDSDDDELVKRDGPGFHIAAVDLNGTAEVVINGFGFNNKTVTLSRQCFFTLNWPVEKLANTKREDITFIAFQFWVLGMSIVALLNESIPHIVASLLTHVVATAWGGFQVWHTEDFRQNFFKLTVEGACGINLLSNYWKPRINAEIASLVLNAVALLLSAFLSWRLFKVFGWQTFKRVGASRTINRVYKLVLTLSIAIQLSLFFIVVSIALWIDSLCNGVIGRLSKDPELLKGVMVVVIVLLVPWLALGWIAVRRELRFLMLVFLVLSFGYLVGWGVMFISPTFRWTFVLWTFFTLMTSASVILTLITLVIGILCRINFGKGLPRYLNAEEPLPDNFEPVGPQRMDYDDEEKVEFPSGQGALPTFSAAFPKDTPPSQMRFASPRVGPRFTNPSIEPFESDRSSQGTYSQRSNDSGYRTQTTYTRETYLRETVSDGATIYDQHRQLARQVSTGSQRSVSSSDSHSSVKTHGSKASYGSYSSTSSSSRRNDPFSKRWMIE